MLDWIEDVVAFWKSGEALVALQGLELAAYNQETIAGSFLVGCYVESLLLLNGHGGAGGDALEEFES